MPLSDHDRRWDANMAGKTVFGFDLSDVELRQSLRGRYAPYWQTLEYGRAVGYQIYRSGVTHWVAKIRLKDASYQQHRLAFTEDNPDIGDQGLSFEAACEAAQEWFAANPFKHLATDARPIGSIDFLKASPIGDVYTVGRALGDYIEWKRVVAARSHFVALVTLINLHFVPRLFSLPAKDMNSERLRFFIKDVLETPPKRGNQPLKPRRPIEAMSEEELRKRRKTTNTLIGVLRMALLMAWENSYIESDRPWRCIRRLNNVDRPRMLHLSRPECFRLLEHCAPDLRTLVLGALYTGCRIKELLNMQASHFGRDGPGVYVTPVKCYRPRVVMLPDEGLAFFQKLAAGKKPNDLLFVRKDGRQWYTNHRPGFKRAVFDAELPEDFCFHGLRHTYASQLVQDGTPLIVVAEQLGHANIDTVSRTYGHLAPDIRKAEIRDKFASLVR
jgi:integrase